ncbi:cell wall-binding repeat-containing protein [Herbiconiux sp. 11R-BC]|uniref:cell wall-binding repeat-containing protein n=1 Tax=Herbiconiux sp. 11R-BC TaxID=3111637 RepID=UPI003BFC9031
MSVLAVVLGGVLASPASPAYAGTQEDGVYDLVNAQRVQASLPMLIRDPQIEAAAEEWANYMGTLDPPLTHSTSEWRASRLPAGWRANGENIAIGQTSSAQVMTDWMNSAGHRANILDGRFTRIGIGYAETGKGRMWVQIFAGYSGDVAPTTQPLNPTPTPTISGTPAVAQTLTASAGTWGPGPVSLSYQWNVGGASVPGATLDSYLPDQSAVGRTVTVTVTGSRQGYASASRTSAPTGAVTSSFTTGRVSGADRYEVGVAVAARAYPGGAPVVYVATGTNYPDALSAGPAAAAQGGPLLLTSPDALPASVAAEIAALHPSTIVIVGGTASVSPAVEGALRGLAPTVTRLSGADRFEASRAIVNYAFQASGASTAYVATGLNFPDALSAGGAGGHTKSPVLLVNGQASGADAATTATLLGLHTQSVKVAGGPASVSNGIATSLSLVGSVTRLSGDDRYAASVAINRDAYSSASRAYLATGVTFPDALSGSALAGAEGAPLFVVPPDCVPRAVLSSLRDLGVTDVQLIGGPASLSAAVQNLTACAW